MQVEEIECMKIKKKVIRYAIGGMIVLWLLLGLFARRGALYLMGDDRSVLSRSDDDVPCFGIGIYSMPKDSNYVRWLNESECKVLWQQILSGEKDGIGAYINIWMYNEMSRRSFGRFADHWYFRKRSMRSQYMWWNWKERITFNGKGVYHDAR